MFDIRVEIVAAEPGHSRGDNYLTPLSVVLREREILEPLTALI